MASITKKQERAEKKIREGEIAKAQLARDLAASKFLINAKAYTKGTVDEMTVTDSMNMFTNAHFACKALEGGA